MLTSREYWDRRQERPAKEPNYYFHPILSEYLPKTRGLDAIEIGCFPGGLLLYFADYFGYRVSGIDWTHRIDMVKRVLSSRGAKVGDFIERDFLQFVPNKKYDVVASFGFVEHFKDGRDIVRRQLNLVKPGGIAVIQLPNYRGINGILGKVIDPDVFRYHNPELMDAVKLREVVVAEGFDILFGGYFGEFQFSVMKRPLARLARLLFPHVRTLLRLSGVECSTCLIFVGRRREA